MAKYNKFDAETFPDERGWEQHDETICFSPNPYFNFLKQFEKGHQEKWKINWKQNSHEKMEKSKQNSTIANKQSQEAEKPIHDKEPQLPSICIFQSIDLANNKKNLRYRWNKQTKQYIKVHEVRVGATSKLQQLSKQKKKPSSPQPRSDKKAKNILNTTRVLRVQLHQLAEVDDVAQRYLRDYYKEKQEVKFKFPKRQRIFQLPLRHSII